MRERLDGMKAIIWHIEKITGRPLSRSKASRLSHPALPNRIPVRYDIGGSVWAYADEIEAYATAGGQRRQRRVGGK